MWTVATIGITPTTRTPTSNCSRARRDTVRWAGRRRPSERGSWPGLVAGAAGAICCVIDPQGSGLEPQPRISHRRPRGKPGRPLELVVRETGLDGRAAWRRPDHRSDVLLVQGLAGRRAEDHFDDAAGECHRRAGRGDVLRGVITAEPDGTECRKLLSGRRVEDRDEVVRCALVDSQCHGRGRSVPGREGPPLPAVRGSLVRSSPEPPELPAPGPLSFAGGVASARWLGSCGASAVASVAVSGAAEGSAGCGRIGRSLFGLVAVRARACARLATSAW